MLAQWWIFRITAEGIYRAAFMAIRIILLVVGTSLLTSVSYTHLTLPTNSRV